MWNLRASRDVAKSIDSSNGERQPLLESKVERRPIYTFMRIVIGYSPAIYDQPSRLQLLYYIPSNIFVRSESFAVCIHASVVGWMVKGGGSRACAHFCACTVRCFNIIGEWCVCVSVWYLASNLKITFAIHTVLCSTHKHNFVLWIVAKCRQLRNARNPVLFVL